MSEEIAARMLAFAGGCIQLTGGLNRTMAGRHIAGQLLRSSSSSGANYQEACGAESRADFIHKVQISLKELRESEYWLKLIGVSLLTPETSLTPLLKEVDELIRIMARSAVTAKSKQS